MLFGCKDSNFLTHHHLAAYRIYMNHRVFTYRSVQDGLCKQVHQFTLHDALNGTGAIRGVVALFNHMVFKFRGELNLYSALGKVLSQLEDNATLTTSFDHNWEIGGKTTSKARALEELGKILGVEREEMMSFGDSPNDIPMIKAAGIGVAVGNAKDSVKEAADYVTLSNDEAGVARAVEKFVFGE